MCLRETAIFVGGKIHIRHGSLHQRAKFTLLVYNAWLSGYLYWRRYLDCLVNNQCEMSRDFYRLGETQIQSIACGRQGWGWGNPQSQIPLQQLQVALPIRFSSYTKLVFIWVEKCKQWAPRGMELRLSFFFSWNELAVEIHCVNLGKILPVWVINPKLSEIILQEEFLISEEWTEEGSSVWKRTCGEW